MPGAKRTSRQTRTARLTELYHQLQAVMPLLEEIAQPARAKPESHGGEDRPGDVREADQSYAPPAAPGSGDGSRYRFEKRDREAWAVLDTHDGDALLALTKYKRGATALVERLEDYERRMAELSHTPPRPAPDGDHPVLPAPP